MKEILGIRKDGTTASRLGELPVGGGKQLAKGVLRTKTGGKRKIYHREAGRKM